MIGAVCAQCRLPMRLVKLGRVVRDGGCDCWSGDEYECPHCKAKIVTGFAKEGYVDRSLLGEFMELTTIWR
jgi:hypothetical protein